VPGGRAVDIWHGVRWTPRARGTYRYHIHAEDLAGNAQTRIGEATITVR